MQRSTEQLKYKFSRGSKPTQQDFADLIDTLDYSRAITQSISGKELNKIPSEKAVDEAINAPFRFYVNDVEIVDDRYICFDENKQYIIRLELIKCNSIRSRCVTITQGDLIAQYIGDPFGYNLVKIFEANANNNYDVSVTANWESGEMEFIFYPYAIYNYGINKNNFRIKLL